MISNLPTLVSLTERIELVVVWLLIVVLFFEVQPVIVHRLVPGTQSECKTNAESMIRTIRPDWKYRLRGAGYFCVMVPEGMIVNPNGKLEIENGN